ncbi:EI24 domain-containing protein [Rhodococcus sp. 06-1460-1B]|uniref:EI24 domain-containing protein n=1 Tax=Rhodococcus sp. 06-1460-1B TaxID=2022501 RepID=UPI001140741A|nr:EI24 domain-containing protein [Rhodococcus sp. 06-1460-1B]
MKGVLLLASVAIVSALIQALTVVGDPAPTSSLGFAALVVISAATVMCALWFTASTALDVVDGNVSGALSRTWRRPRVLAWCVVLTGAAVALAILFPLLPVVVIVIALLILPAAVDGRRNPLRAALHTVKQSPWRCIAAAVITILAYLLGWVVALVLGFFVTGVVAAFLTWLWFGATAAALLVYWSTLYRKGVGI